MDKLQNILGNHDIVGIDTSIFIYHLENHETYRPLTTAILNTVQSGTARGIVSTVMLMELTVHPWRQNRSDIARQYEALLSNFPNLQIADVTRTVARKAAQLRANYQIRPADALHVATAIVHDTTLWISNDKQLQRLQAELSILVLDDFI